jgi:hypothetical protein
MLSKPFNNFLKLQMKIKRVEYEHVERARHTNLRVAQMSLATTNVKYVKYATNQASNMMCSPIIQF